MFIIVEFNYIVIRTDWQGLTIMSAIPGFRIRQAFEYWLTVAVKNCQFALLIEELLAEQMEFISPLSPLMARSILIVYTWAAVII
jgi:hypothetical protein